MGSGVLQGTQTSTVASDAPISNSLVMNVQQPGNHLFSSVLGPPLVQPGANAPNTQQSKHCEISTDRFGISQQDPSQVGNNRQVLAQIISKQDRYEGPWTSVKQQVVKRYDFEELAGADLGFLTDEGLDWNGVHISSRPDDKNFCPEKNASDVGDNMNINVPDAHFQVDTEPNYLAQEMMYQDPFVEDQPAADSTTAAESAVASEQLAEMNTHSQVQANNVSLDNLSLSALKNILKELDKKGGLEKIGLKLMPVTPPQKSSELNVQPDQTAEKGDAAQYPCEHDGCKSSFPSMSLLRSVFHLNQILILHC